jgi:methionyl-tRNA formyltransferase
MTDLPLGRGGSPLQNLVIRGKIETRLTALRCCAELDAGPVYLKRPLSPLGTAEEILLRASQLILEMIECIIVNQPTPYPQFGETVTFSRRTARDGNIASIDELTKIFDHIRMLDADGYPRAFLETNDFRFECGRASLRNDPVIADVKILPRKP